MRNKIPDVLEKGRIREPRGSYYPYLPGEWFGRFIVKAPTKNVLALMISTGDPDTWASCGWPPPSFDHVSVSVLGETRCPTWEEMCFVKELCFDDTETVVQYHPPKADNRSLHDYCLHLWRAVGVDFPRPHGDAVAPVGETAWGVLP